MQLRLDGQRVVITAAASGIGRATLETFVAAGARVCVCDVDASGLEELRASLPEVGAMLADVSDPADVDALFDKALAKLGGLDILVNNAGIAGPTAAVEAIAPDDWRRTIAVNLDGQFHCLRRAVPLLKDSRDGAIIAMSSIAGRLGYAYRLPYAATKWAIIGMVKSLAIELGDHGIRVNAVLPGYIDVDEGGQHLSLAYREGARGASPLGRAGTPDDVARGVLLLASSLADYISGATIVIDGGASAGPVGLRVVDP